MGTTYIIKQIKKCNNVHPHLDKIRNKKCKTNISCIPMLTFITMTIITHIKHNMKISGLVHHVETKIINHLQRKQEFKSNIFTQLCKN
jgi:hypothetical protein